MEGMNKVVYETYKKITEIRNDDGLSYEEREKLVAEIYEKANEGYDKAAFNRYFEYLETFFETIYSEKTVGIELEYGGSSNYCNASHPLTLTVKHDCSVSGDGREFNLIHKKLSEIRDSVYKKDIESFMVTAANNRCTESFTAGNHIHFAFAHDTCHDRESDTAKYLAGGIKKAINEANYTVYGSKWKPEFENPDEPVWRTWYVFKNKVKRAVDINTGEERRISYLYYNALEWLYTVSNRRGTERFGLGTDITRGYTYHGTTEIRAFKTSLDYRTILARIEITNFFLNYIAKLKFLTENEYVSDTEYPTIWDEMNREGNKNVKDKYTYLAFHHTNKHYVGLSEEDLRKELNKTKSFVLAVKKRSRMIQKSLNRKNAENEVKELFKF